MLFQPLHSWWLTFLYEEKKSSTSIKIFLADRLRRSYRRVTKTRHHSLKDFVTLKDPTRYFLVLFVRTYLFTGCSRAAKSGYSSKLHQRAFHKQEKEQTGDIFPSTLTASIWFMPLTVRLWFRLLLWQWLANYRMRLKKKSKIITGISSS